MAYYKYAWICGYEMAPEDYRDFICSLPTEDDEEVLPPDATWDEYYEEYSQWKRQFPESIRRHLPAEHVRYMPGVDHNLPLEPHKTWRSFVFRHRYIRFRGREQVEDPSHPDYHRIVESDKDRAGLEHFARFVQEHGGKFDKSKVKYTYFVGHQPWWKGDSQWKFEAREAARRAGKLDPYPDLDLVEYM